MRRTVAVLALGVALAACRAEPPPAPHTRSVTLRAMAFDPPQLALAAGDTVEWHNADLVPHTATAEDRSFDSGPLAPGATWKTVVTRPGTIAYGCTLHPMMKGTLVVH